MEMDFAAKVQMDARSSDNGRRKEEEEGNMLKLQIKSYL